nr:15401_t:CDS:2 [Entrophospora candida]
MTSSFLIGLQNSFENLQIEYLPSLDINKSEEKIELTHDEAEESDHEIETRYIKLSICKNITAQISKLETVLNHYKITLEESTIDDYVYLDKIDIL